MSSSVPAARQAQAFPDGTTEYKPLRSNGSQDPNKVHIADTPMTWSNMHKHVNWLNTTFIIIIPALGFLSTYWVPLQLKTAIFAIIYYFNTGLGITAGKFTGRDCPATLTRCFEMNIC
jgi:stearoyl-CoA desaturase (delta-9 desaturase)